MKKLLLIFSSFALTLAASAQVSVNRHGQIVVGNAVALPLTQSESVQTQALDISPSLPGAIYDFKTDSLARICIVGDVNNYNRSGGYISFGNSNYVRVGEYASKNTDPNALQLYGSILRYDRENGNVFTCSSTGMRFNCNVTVDGVAVTSDSRLKSDVQQLDGALTLFDGITPVSYRLVSSSPAKVTTVSTNVSEEITGRIPADDAERFGFIAQEVREIFPQLVSEDEVGYLAVDYIGFIPLLVDAVKQFVFTRK